MIKSLIGALMVATINAPMPRINDTEEEQESNIQITESIDSTIILNSDVGTPQAYIYQSQTKTDFEIQQNEYYLRGTQYAYTYGNVQQGAADTKAVYVESGTDMTMDRFPHKPFNITVINLQNYKQYTKSRLYIEFNYNAFNVSAAAIRNYKIYASTNNNVLDLMNANNWSNENQNFYKYVNDYCENNLYTSLIKQESKTSNAINVFETDLSSLTGLAANYLIILTFISTADNQAGNVGQYVVNNGAVGIISTSDTYWTHFYNINTTTTVNYDVIDLPNLMFTILTMPFSFISQAFNLKLFPNTPYYIDVSSLFLAIVATMTFIFIIKLILNRS